MQVGDLLLKKSNRNSCVCVKETHPKYGNSWIKVFINGKCSKWTPHCDYEAINASR